MQQRVIIHAGLPKTGTTAIQIAITDAHSSLSDNGIWSPCSETRTSERDHAWNGLMHPHERLVWDLIAQDPPYPPAPLRLGEAIARFRDDDAHHTLLLSQENLSQHPHRLRQHHVQALKALGPVEVVLFLRPVLSFMRSLYREIVFSAHMPKESPHHFLQHSTWMQMGYTGIYACLRLLGPVQVIDYPTARRHGGSVRAFAEATGLPLSDETRMDSNAKTHSVQATLFAFHLNCLSPPPEIVREIHALLGNLDFPDERDGQPYSLFPARIEEQALARYAQDRRVILSETGVDLTPETPSPVSYHQPRLRPRAMETLADLFSGAEGEVKEWALAALKRADADPV